MIGVLDVAVQAHNPEMPLYPLVAFANSSSSVRIRNVPKQIGQWRITDVILAAEYPDNTTKTASCVLVNNVWVGTVGPSTDPGEGTYGIYASGLDEHGQPVTDYCLGSGQVTIMQQEVRPEANALMHMLYQEPTAEIREGDTFQGSDGNWYVFKNSVALPFAVTSCFYEKSETSSAAELENAFANVSVDLSEYAKASDLETVSSAVSSIETGLSDFITDQKLNEVSADLNGKIETLNETLTSAYYTAEEVDGVLDDALSGYLPLSGDATLSGDLTLSGNLVFSSASDRKIIDARNNTAWLFPTEGNGERVIAGREWVEHAIDGLSAVYAPLDELTAYAQSSQLNDLSVATDESIISGLNDLSTATDESIISGLNDLSTATNESILSGLNDLSVATNESILSGLNDLSVATNESIISGLNDVSAAAVLYVDEQIQGVEETMSAVTFSGEYEGGGTFEFQIWAVAEPEQQDPGNGE